MLLRCLLFRGETRTSFRLSRFSLITDLNIRSYITFLFGTERCLDLGSVMQNRTVLKFSFNKSIHNKLKLKTTQKSINSTMKLWYIQTMKYKSNKNDLQLPTQCKWFLPTCWMKKANHSISHNIQNCIKLICDYFLRVCNWGHKGSFCSVGTVCSSNGADYIAVFSLWKFTELYT